MDNQCVDVKGIKRFPAAWAATGEFFDTIASNSWSWPTMPSTPSLRSWRLAGGGKVLMVVVHTPMRRGSDELKPARPRRLGRRARFGCARARAAGPFQRQPRSGQALSAELADTPSS